MAGSTYNKDSLTLNVGDVDNSLKITTEFSRMSDTFGFTYDNSIISVTPATITSGDIKTVTLTITALASGTTTLIWNYDSVTYPSNPASVSITVAPSDYKVLVNNSSLQNIADAIRGKNGSVTTYLPSEMATAIGEIITTDIEEADLTASAGYIKFKNGFMIQWKSKSSTLGGNEWTSTCYYSDTDMGNWSKAFTSLFIKLGSCSSALYNVAVEDSNSQSSAIGVVRVTRPNNGTTSGTIRVLGIGTWK